MSDDCKKLKEEASKSPEAMKKMEADAEACGKDKKDDKKGTLVLITLLSLKKPLLTKWLFFVPIFFIIKKDYISTS